jgi:hypothetical protein
MSNELSPELRLNAAGNVVLAKKGERKFKIRYFLRPEHAEAFKAAHPDKELPEMTEEFTGTLRQVKDRAFFALLNLDSSLSKRLTYEITGEYANGWKVVK